MKSRLHLFDAYGIELEYMIVDRETLAVRPISDELLKHELGSYGGDFENGSVTWSNELVLHVIELKCTQPEANLPALEDAFAANIKRINTILHDWNAMLLPSAAHPFMNPETETRLWPHDNNEVYAIYNQIFGCKGHGWSNLQSTHLNLPFANDDEFGKLHAAIRVILPLLPALCASSPILDGKRSGLVDTRLSFYKTNQAKIPSITGEIIPEPVFTEQEHEDVILKRIEKDIAPYNQDEILDPVWVNSRGAMSRFDRGSIEIRIMDIQECPAADMAIVTLVTELLKALVSEKLAPLTALKSMPTAALAGMLHNTIQQGQQARFDDPDYLRLFGCSGSMSARELWLRLIHQQHIGRGTLSAKQMTLIELILQQGTLSDRIVQAIGADASEATIFSVYRHLSECLAANQMFEPKNYSA